MKDLIHGINEHNAGMKNPKVVYSLAYAIGWMKSSVEQGKCQKYTPSDVLALLKIIDGCEENHD